MKPLASASAKIEQHALDRKGRGSTFALVLTPAEAYFFRRAYTDGYPVTVETTYPRDPMERRPDESFADIKARRAAANAEAKFKRTHGRLVPGTGTGGALRAGRVRARAGRAAARGVPLLGAGAPRLRLHPAGCMERTRLTDHNYLGHWARWLKKKGKLAVDVTAELVAPEVEHTFKDPVAIPSLSAARVAVHPWTLFFDMHYFTGPRSSELATLTWQQLLFSTARPEPKKPAELIATVRYTSIKGSRKRTRAVPVSDRDLVLQLAWLKIWVALSDIMLGRRVLEGPVFLTQKNTTVTADAWWAICDKACRAHSIPHFGPHRIRHTFAVHPLAGSGDLRAVQELLGHESSKTTEIYTHTTEHRARQVTSTLPRIDVEAAPRKGKGAARSGQSKRPVGLFSHW